jgi:glycosyltransferase involved in cell wall biosynthesis
MQIGIEARWVCYDKTGFGNYALNLLKEIAKIDSINKFTIYLNEEFDAGRIGSNTNFEYRVIKRPPEIYKHLSIPGDLLLSGRRIDFFHFLYNAPSLWMPCPFVVTVHDVSFRHVPNMISIKDRWSLNLQFHLRLRKANKIITVSQNSKDDIIKYYGIPENKIVVIYEGVDSSFRVISDGEEKRAIAIKYNLPDKFILYVGTYLPHKNIDTLLRAYNRLRSHNRISHALVLAGKKGRNFSLINSLINELGLNNDVRTIGYVPPEDLPYIYNLSSAFVFPSFYEGFGLPLLEAMACGIPVVASRASCLPEIGGDAAIYFSPKDSLELAEVLKKVIEDKAIRHNAITKGLRRIDNFSWRRMAEKTLEVYEGIFGKLSTR